MKSRSKLDRLLIGTSAIAMAVSSAIAAAQESAQRQEGASTPSSGQSAEGEVTTITVTGIRASLENAAEIKRKADTFVDSVTASDVTSLPDMSVAEALERLRSAAGTKYDRRAIKALTALDEKLQVRPSGREEGAIVRGQGTSSICIRT